MQQHAGGGVAQPGQPARPVLGGQQVLIRARQVGVDHHRVGGQALPVAGVHRAGPAAGHLDAFDLGPVAEGDPGVGGGRGQRPGDGVHAAAREVDAGHGVHVGDHRVDGQRVLRCQAGIHRLEGEDPPQPLVGQVLPDLGRQPAQATEGHQPDPGAAQQLQRGVQVAVDEAVAFEPVQRAQEVHQPPVTGRVPGGGDLGDLGGHPVGVGVHVDPGAVGEVGAIGRVQRQQLQPVGQPFTDAGQGVVEQFGHGEHRRTGVEPVTPELQHAGPATGPGRALDDGDLPAGAGQPQRGRQPAEAGTDDHHGVGGTADRAKASGHNRPLVSARLRRSRADGPSGHRSRW